MAHIIFVTFSGYIKTPSSFALDNGLANLAGALIDNGHEVLIEDLNTVSNTERLTPDNLLSRTEEIGNLVGSKKRDSDQVFTKIKQYQEELDFYQNKIIEQMFWQLASKIKKNNTSMVGFKVWAGDGCAAIKRWCAMLKEFFPRIKIMLGGPNCEIAPERTALFIRNFDFMITGKAEQSIVDLANHIDRRGSLDKVGGLLYLAGDRVVRNPFGEKMELDDLPIPRYQSDVYPTAGTPEKLNYVVIDESRGCPMRCHFCVHPEFSAKWQKKSIERVLKEIDIIQRDLGTKYFRFAGSYTPPKLIFDLSKAIIDKGVDINFGCFMHLNGMNVDYLDTLYEAGLRTIFYGIETVNEKLQVKAGNKKISKSVMEHVIKETSKKNIYTTGSLIFPMPFETKDTEAETFEFLKTVFAENKYGYVQVLNPCPLPGTKWWKERERFGFEFNDNEVLDQFLTMHVRHMFPPEFTDTLPYTLENKGHKDLAKISSQFISKLEEAKVTTNISDEISMIAMGVGKDPLDFKKEMGKAFIRGDIETIRDMVTTFNESKVVVEEENFQEAG